MDQLDELKLTDYVKKKRRRSFWRGVLFTILAFVAVLVVSLIGSGHPSGDHIARIRVQGVIMADDYRAQMLEEIAENERVKALIVRIDSGGGAVYPSEALYNQLRTIAQTRPVVAVMEGAAASGAYITALGADHIVAGETTVTASIGVIAEMVNVSDVMERLGVETTLIRSSDSKGGISPFRDPTPEELANEQALIDEIYDWFRDLVGERRGLSGNALNQVASGGVVTGLKAFELGLVDEIGNELEARAYLDAEDAALADLEIYDWAPAYPTASFTDRLAASIADTLAKTVTEQLYQNVEPRFGR